MRPSVSGFVNVRPVRFGLITSPTESGLRDAIVVATRHWGGVTWPILPIDDADKLVRIAQALDLDALVALTDAPAAVEASTQSGFAWSRGDSPFSEDVFLREARPMSMAALLATDPTPRPQLMNVTWDADHPLSLLLECLIGSFGDASSEPGESDRVAFTAKSLSISLGSSAPLNHVVPLRTPIYYTAHGLLANADTRWRGFVVVDPDSADDLIWFWNIRATGEMVLPWPTRRADLLLQPAESLIQKVVDGGSEESAGVPVWCRDGTAPDDLLNLIRSTDAEARIIGTANTRILPSGRVQTMASERGRRFNIDLDEGAGGITIPMPPPPFGRDLPWWESMGKVIAEVHVSTELNMPLGYRTTAPNVRWLAGGPLGDARAFGAICPTDSARRC